MQPDDELDQGPERKVSENFASVDSRMSSTVTNVLKRKEFWERQVKICSHGV